MLLGFSSDILEAWVRVCCVHVFLVFKIIHLQGDFWGQRLVFSWQARTKSTGTCLPEMTSNWESLRTTVNNLHGAKLGFCLKNLIFVSKNRSELFGKMQQYFQVCLLPQIRIIAEKSRGHTVRHWVPMWFTNLWRNVCYVDTTTAFFEIDTVQAPIRITQTLTQTDQILTQTQKTKLVTQALTTTQTHVRTVSTATATIRATADTKTNAQPWETAWQKASSTKPK